jgi:hypothetical protein
MKNVGNRVSCQELFKKLSILPLHSQYIWSLLLFVDKNIKEFNLTWRFTPSTLAIGLVYSLHQQNLANITKESTTQGLKFSINYLKVLKTYPGMSKNLN